MCVCVYVCVCVCHIGILVRLNGLIENRTSAYTELFGAGTHTEPRRYASRGRAYTAPHCRLKGSDHCFLYVVAHYTLHVLVITSDHLEKRMFYFLQSVFEAEFSVYSLNYSQPSAAETCLVIYHSEHQSLFLIWG